MRRAGQRKRLLSKIAGGNIGYGMEAVGDGKSTRGSELIIEAVDRDDPRPVCVAINAGANTLAQALWDVRRDRSPEEVARFASKLRVYDDAGQDNAGAWICHNFPDIFYIRSRKQVFALYGPKKGPSPAPWEREILWKDDLSHTNLSPRTMSQWVWAEINVRRRHGILGALYPQRVNEQGHVHPLEGGGSTYLSGLVNKGLFDPEQLSWGGWGGRFAWKKEQVPANSLYVPPLEKPYEPFLMYPEAADTWRDGETLYEDSVCAPVFRWRADYTNDFQGRMDRCVAERGQANHHPIAAFNGDTRRSIVRLQAEPGERLELDASASSDPDGDALDFRWYVYPEAGNYAGELSVVDEASAVASLEVPQDAAGKQMHVILEVSDRNPIVPLKSYRRVVIDA